MQLTDSQNKIVEDKHRFRVVVCGRKFGKTTLSSEEMLACCLYKNEAKVKYIAPTLQVARNLMWERLKNRLGGAIQKENDTRLNFSVKNAYNSISELSVGSWELVNNYRGDEYDFLVFDEVQEYKNFWVGWQEAMRPTLSPRKGSALFMGTPKGYNHLYDAFHNQDQKLAPAEDFKSFHFSTYDNPNIDPTEIESAKKQLTTERFSQEYLADFVKSEGLVFKEFYRDINTFDYPLYGYQEKLGGVDFGYTNPAAIITVGVKEGTYYVIDELYKTGMTDIDVAEYVAAKQYSMVFPDPENPAGIKEMKKKRVNIREVVKGKDSIVHGIDKIRELFKARKLFIHKSCVNLISELETYSYPDTVDYRNNSENPIDKENHAIDALRYIISMHALRKPVVQRPFHDHMKTVWDGK